MVVFRRLRAALSIALLWALGWLPIGLVLALFADSRGPQPSDVISRPVAVPLFVAAWTVWGALSGGAFALVLAVSERRRTIETLSTARTAVWGALGAVVLPLVLTSIDLVRTDSGLLGYSWRFPLLVLGVSATLGAACAATTLALARRSVS
jgi:hypothetical protein